MRAAVGAGLAVGVAMLLGLASPLYALVSAVIVTDLDSAKTRKLAIPRLVGTAIGATTGCVATLLVQPGALAVVGAVLVPMFLCQLLNQSAAAKVAGYVSGIVLVSFSASPWEHARDRLVETVLGILAAALVSAVPVLARAAQAGREAK